MFLIPSHVGTPFAWPLIINLFELGLYPYKPQKWDGILMLPPLSLPNPKGDPFIAINPPSPPVEPPEVLYGS